MGGGLLVYSNICTTEFQRNECQLNKRIELRAERVGCLAFWYIVLLLGYLSRVSSAERFNQLTPFVAIMTRGLG